MRTILITIGVSILLTPTAVANAEPPKVLDLANGNSQAITVTAGKPFTVQLKNVIPGKKYMISDGSEDRPITVPELDKSGEADCSKVKDDATAKQKVSALLKGQDTDEAVLAKVVTGPDLTGCNADAQALVKKALTSAT